jgi:hypothetical protein
LSAADRQEVQKILQEDPDLDLDLDLQKRGFENIMQAIQDYAKRVDVQLAGSNQSESLEKLERDLDEARRTLDASGMLPNDPPLENDRS